MIPPADDTIEPDTLRLGLLGGLSITLGGAPVRGFLSSKVQALLCYLAVSGRAHNRESLMTLLWGDMPEERAAHGLRQALSNLQKLVGPYLDVTRQTAAFNRSAPYYLDTESFDTLIKQARSANTRRAPGANRRLREAVDLYTGDFLEGFYVRDAPDFEEWAAGQRELLRHMALDALHRLSGHHFTRGEYQAAAGYLRRLLELDPWREDAHRQLMLLFAYEGQSSAALAQYRACVRVLSEELGDEPTAETTELYRRIRAGAVEIPPRPQPPGNLPPQSEPVIGRRSELDKIEAMLEDPTCRLLTLSGPGGVGKTRLALQAAADLADEFEHGAFWVPLAPVSDPALVLGTIAHTLGIEDGSGTAHRDAVRTALRDSEILLILDNFEHLLASASLVSELLEASPRLRVLVTSRASLRVRNEWIYHVPPLALPPLDDPALPEVVSRFSSAAMFAERAQLARPDFAITDANARAVAEICHRLEGLPLAIELAAARLNMMPVHALLARLENRLGILTGGPRDLSERQQTLRATLAWSYDLLSESQRDLFRKIALFAGGCTLEAAEAVCGPGEAARADAYVEAGVLEGLTSLVDNSLVQREEMPGGDDPGAMRFRMLETVREYALEQLEKAGDEENVRRRHAEYFVSLAQLAEPQLRGPQQNEWLDRLEAEHDNLRAVLGWARDSADQQAVQALELEMRLGGFLWRFWRVRGYLSEGRKWLDDLLSRPGQVSVAARAEALRGAGVLAFTQGDLKDAADLCEEGLTLYTEIGDSAGSAGVLNTLGNTRREQGDYDSAMVLYERSLSLYRELGDGVGVSVSLNNLCPILHTRGELARAAALYEESLGLRRSAGDTGGIAYTLDKLAEVLRDRGELDRAAALCEESLAMRRQIGDKHGMTLALVTLGMIYHEQGDDTRSEPLFKESLSLCRDLGEAWGVATAMNNLASVALERCEYETARDLWEESGRLYRENGDNKGVATCLSGLGQVAHSQSDCQGARKLHEESLALSRNLGDVRAVAAELNRLGSVLCKLGEYDDAFALFAESARTCLGMDEKRILVRSLGGLAAVQALRGDAPQSALLWGAADALRESAGVHVPPRERATWDGEMGKARAALGDKAWIEAWESGRAMPVESVVALAFEDSSPAES